MVEINQRRCRERLLPRVLWLLVCLMAVGFCSTAGANTPRLLVEGLRLEQIAAEPDIVTPVGVAFDNSGRLLVVESHTHKRQAGYDGPKGDRIRTFSDSDGDGVFDTWGVFAEGFTHALNLAVHPATGDVFLACRNDIHRLRDTDGDGVADADDVIVRCDTKEKYPHNGLGGLAISGDRLFLGMGENFDRPFTLVGADGSQIAGRGGQGIIFTCDLEGQRIERLAIGVWNPFGMCLVRGQLFAVDNDPHASPPCRLLHVVPGADYGHRREFSSSGLHPLQAWNGELPGTRGMLAGTGEAPCAVLWHEQRLWVTSWGDHRIESYQVFGDSASREVIVQGDADFRPTGMVLGPDGAFYFADWVSRSYPVHGEGRLWRLSGPGLAPPKLEPRSGVTVAKDFEGIRNASSLPTGPNVLKPEQWRPRIPTDFFTQKSKQSITDLLPGGSSAGSRGWIEWLAQYRFAGLRLRDSDFRTLLGSDNADVRLFAVRWLAEEHRTKLKPDVATLLNGEIPSERYYLAVLAAVDWLSKPPEQRASNFADGLLARELRNPNRQPKLKAIALRLISPNHKQLTTDAVRGFLASDHQLLKTEAVRTLVVQSNPERFALLKEVIADESFGDAFRADAVAGLAAVAADEEPLLQELSKDASPVVRAEAERTLRLAKLIPSKVEEKPPVDLRRDFVEQRLQENAWLELLDAEPGDADSGRRLFFSSVGARCGVCHQHSGRGGQIGPDLTLTAKKLSRRRLLASILWPSAEIAPQYTPWVLETVDGRVLSGLRLAQAGDNGKEWYAGSDGKKFMLRSEEIDYRAPSEASIMPSGLQELISVQDMRDLLAFLQSE